MDQEYFAIEALICLLKPSLYFCKVISRNCFYTPIYMNILEKLSSHFLFKLETLSFDFYVNANANKHYVSLLWLYIKKWLTRVVLTRADHNDIKEIAEEYMQIYCETLAQNMYTMKDLRQLQRFLELIAVDKVFPRLFSS